MQLTKPQKLIYDMEKFAGGTIAVICGSILVNGDEDLSLIKKMLINFIKLIQHFVQRCRKWGLKFPKLCATIMAQYEIDGNTINLKNDVTSHSLELKDDELVEKDGTTYYQTKKSVSINSDEKDESRLLDMVERKE